MVGRKSVPTLKELPAVKLKRFRLLDGQASSLQGQKEARLVGLVAIVNMALHERQSKHHYLERNKTFKV